MKNIFIVLFLLMPCIMVAQSQWQDVNSLIPSECTLNDVGTSSSKTTIDISIPGFYKKNILISGTTYQRIEILGEAKTTKEGYPEIPVIKALVAIPECSDISVNVLSENTEVYTGYNICPVPEIIDDPELGSKEVFTKNIAAYSNNENYPGIITSKGEIGYFRNQKVAEILIYPIQFNPVTNNITIYKDISVEVNFVNPSGGVYKNNGIFNDISKNILVNYNNPSNNPILINDSEGSVTRYQISNTNGNIDADYIIITAPDFFDSRYTTQIASHIKDKRGLDVAIVNVEDIYNSYYDSQYMPYELEYAIHNFIRSVYNNGYADHSFDGKLAYVMLIGDDDGNASLNSNFEVISGIQRFRLGVKFPSDYPYTRMTLNDEGIPDKFEDLVIGRLSVRNESDLYNIVDKTIRFENDVDNDVWKKNTTYVSGIDNDTDYIVEYTTSLVPSIFNNESYYYFDYNNSEIADSFLNRFNEGTLLSLICSHGRENILVMSTSSNTEYTRLLHSDWFNDRIFNYNKTGFIFTSACMSGGLDLMEKCLAEKVTTIENIGSIGYYGSTREGFGHDSFIPFSSAIWVNKAFTIGNAILQAVKSTHDTYNYYGEPTVNIFPHGYRTEENVTFETSQTISTNFIVESGAKLTIADNTDVYFAKQGKITIDASADIEIGDNVELNLPFGR